MSDILNGIMDIAQLLGYDLIGIETDEGRILFDVETRTPQTVCQNCDLVLGIEHKYDDSRTRVIRHETFIDKSLWIRIRPIRFECPVCGSVQQETLPGVEAEYEYTNHFRARIKDRSLRYPCSQVAREERLPESTVRMLQQEAISDCDYSFEQLADVKRIGIDDFALRKRHSYGVVIVDLDTNKPITVLPSRKKDVVKSWLNRLGKVADIEVAVIDMSTGFKSSVEEALPSVRIVVDLFHVMQHVIEALDQVRRNIQRNQPSGKKRDVFEMRRLLTSNREDLSAKQRAELDSFLEQHPALKEAYELKVRFRLWHRYAGNRCIEGLKKWCNRVDRSNLEPFADVVETLRNWKEHILMYFYCGLTNGVVEGINNKIKAIKRACYGSMNFATLKARVLFSFRS